MSLKELRAKMKRGPSDVIGIDVGQAAVKIVRLRKNGEVISVVGCDVSQGVTPGSVNPAITIPPKLQARFVSIAMSSSEATTKLLTFPGPIDAAFESNLTRNLGRNPDADDRMAYRIITEGSGRIESRVLAASIPEADIAPIMRQFASGLPAPSSVEVSSLAALTAFEAGPVLNSGVPTSGLLDFGTSSSTLSIFHRKTLVLIRRFDFGLRKLLDRVMTTLHIDEKTAINVLSDTAFDISELIADIMGPFTSQLIVSRDFAERRENCSLKSLHIIGGIASSQAAIHELERTLNIGIQIVDPFNIPSLHPESPESLPITDRWRFTAAVGAALGTLEEKP
jgi:Tfp pilus assembly PilM family ATPase